MLRFCPPGSFSDSGELPALILLRIHGIYVQREGAISLPDVLLFQITAIPDRPPDHRERPYLVKRFPPQRRNALQVNEEHILCDT
jgi:hypothetical protein